MKIDFNLGDVTTEEQSKLADAESYSGPSQFLGPGECTLEIKSAEIAEKIPNGDTTWRFLEILAVDGEGRDVKHRITFPTQDIAYGAKRSFVMWKKFKAYATPLSGGSEFDVNKPTWKKELVDFIGSIDKLCGTKIECTLGFDGYHVDYAGKNDKGESTYKIVSTRKNSTKVEQIFDTRDDAKAYAKDNGLFISYLTITKIEKATPPKGW